MLQTYEAIYSDNQLHWINQSPPKLDKKVRVIVVMEVENTVKKPKKDLHDILDRAWGCMGNGKSMDEIDLEMNRMRQEWDRE